MGGWEPPMGGWEPKSSSSFWVTRLRGYAVTHMLLYNQLYPVVLLLSAVKAKSHTLKVNF